MRSELTGATIAARSALSALSVLSVLSGLSALLCASAWAQDEAPEPPRETAPDLAPDLAADLASELAREVAAAVDLPTADARADAAEALAKRKDVTLSQWLAALADFGTFERVEPGVQEHRVALRVGERVETTRITTYVPEAYDPDEPAPLLMSFHGTGGDGSSAPASWQWVADELGMLVVAPTEAGENQGYRFERRERLAGLAALRWARRRFNVDERRVFLTGVSRGGHMTWDLALRYPGRFAGIAPMIGGPRVAIGPAFNLRYLENLVHTPIRDLQGARDDPLLLLNLRVAFERLEKLGAEDAELIEFPDLGHSYDLSAVDWAAFFGTRRRAARPETVVIRAARLDEARSAWVEITKFKRGIDEGFKPRVDPDAWNRADHAAKRRMLLAAAEPHTARLRVAMSAPGEFESEGHGVKAFRLLLTPEMFVPEAPVKVRVGRRTVKRKARPEPEVLLREFVERFDRTFLPVTSVTVR